MKFIRSILTLTALIMLAVMGPPAEAAGNVTGSFDRLCDNSGKGKTQGDPGLQILVRFTNSTTETVVITPGVLTVGGQAISYQAQEPTETLAPGETTTGYYFASMPKSLNGASFEFDASGQPLVVSTSERIRSCSVVVTTPTS